MGKYTLSNGMVIYPPERVTKGGQEAINKWLQDSEKIVSKCEEIDENIKAKHPGWKIGTSAASLRYLHK